MKEFSTYLKIYRYTKILITTTILLLSFQINLISNQVEEGLPFLKNYTTVDYQAHNQNWAICQDQRGVMYFGNEEGVLEFNGSQWTLIPLSNKGRVRSLTLGKDDTIFVGGEGEAKTFNFPLGGRR